jgi:hypothetical protein
MISREDIALIKKAKKGEQRAFTSLFDFYYERIYHFVRTIVI